MSEWSSRCISKSSCATSPLQSTSIQNPKKTLKSFMPPTNSAWILRKVSYFQPIYSLYLLTVNTAWFYTVLYFGKRGGENQRAMKSGDLQLKTTTGSHKYFILNVPGGTNDNEDDLWPVWRTIWRKGNHNAMLCSRNPKTTTQVHSPLLTSISGSATHLWESTSLKICSRICARKLVWHKFILLVS